MGILEFRAVFIYRNATWTDVKKKHEKLERQLAEKALMLCKHKDLTSYL